MEDELRKQRVQIENMTAARMKEAQKKQEACIEEINELRNCYLEIPKNNEEHMEMTKTYSDLLEQKEKEKDEMLQQMKDQADEEKRAFMQEIE